MNSLFASKMESSGLAAVVVKAATQSAPIINAVVFMRIVYHKTVRDGTPNTTWQKHRTDDTELW